MSNVDDIIQLHDEQMGRTVVNLQHEFQTIRTGRASGAMLERIMVDYYGAMTSVTQLAGIRTPEAHMLIIEPWDKTTLKSIEKAIMASDLGITPSNDGTVIRLPFPPPTEERRKELVKQCRHMAEEAKIAVRNIRRDANAKLERLIKDEDLSKDDEHRAEERTQKITDIYISKIDEVLKAKEVEVMEV